MTRDDLKALATIIRHRDLLRANMHRLTTELQRRAILHDVSKLSRDEVEGFADIGKAAREHAYGTPEYAASMESAKGPQGCITLHYERNSHHPEHHAHERDMGWLDVIEMVLDWKAASDAYGHYSLRDSLPKHRERFDFSEEQWWLIEQVVEWIEPPDIRNATEGLRVDDGPSAPGHTPPAQPGEDRWTLIDDEPISEQPDVCNMRLVGRNGVEHVSWSERTPEGTWAQRSLPYAVLDFVLNQHTKEQRQPDVVGWVNEKTAHTLRHRAGGPLYTRPRIDHRDAPDGAELVFLGTRPPDREAEIRAEARREVIAEVADAAKEEAAAWLAAMDEGCPPYVAQGVQHALDALIDRLSEGEG